MFVFYNKFSGASRRGEGHNYTITAYIIKLNSYFGNPASPASK